MGVTIFKNVKFYGAYREFLPMLVFVYFKITCNHTDFRILNRIQ